MSTQLTSKSQSIFNAYEISIPKNIAKPLKFIIVLGIALALGFLNAWLALGFVIFYCVIMSKDFFSFIIYVFQLDFDFSKDIFNDLEPM